MGSVSVSLWFLNDISISVSCDLSRISGVLCVTGSNSPIVSSSLFVSVQRSGEFTIASVGGGVSDCVGGLGGRVGGVGGRVGGLGERVAG